MATATIAPDRYCGTIRRIGNKGFGFITTDDGREVFFNVEELELGVRFLPGMRVSFALQIVDDREHDRAVKVKVLA